MQRRKLWATAGALSVTAFAATIAIGAGFGLVGEAQPDSPVGRLHDQRSVTIEATAVAPDSSVPITTPRLGPGADD